MVARAAQCLTPRSIRRSLRGFSFRFTSAARMAAVPGAFVASASRRCPPNPGVRSAAPLVRRIPHRQTAFNSLTPAAVECRAPASGPPQRVRIPGS